MAVDMQKAGTLAHQIRTMVMDVDLKIAELQNMGFTTKLDKIDSGLHVFEATVVQEVTL